MAVLLLVAVRRVCTAYVPGSNTHERRPSTLSTHRHARKRRPGGMGGRLGGRVHGQRKFNKVRNTRCCCVTERGENVCRWLRSNYAKVFQSTCAPAPYGSRLLESPTLVCPLAGCGPFSQRLCIFLGFCVRTRCRNQ